MCWKTIRLELASAPHFPNGSAARAYLLHLPLDSDGRLEEHEFARAPALATVRRHWPNERDSVGNLILNQRGWANLYGREEERIFCPERNPLQPGQHVTVIELNGSRMRYRVM